ncbi:MAG: pyrroline-5-carboxylate reductase family protein, partial [Bacteroidales bacterium]
MEAGIEMGFSASASKQIAIQTMRGALEYLEKTDEHPEAAIDKVTTPGGITIKGINELEHEGFTSAIIKAYKSCK